LLGQIKFEKLPLVYYFQLQFAVFGLEFLVFVLQKIDFVLVLLDELQLLFLQVWGH
jgi:hypothetical protein